MKLKKLVPLYDENVDFTYSEDVNRIVDVCKFFGYSISFEHAREVWQDHSNDWSVDWLELPKDIKKILRVILDYTKEINEGL
jgi:hypothetical protein